MTKTEQAMTRIFAICDHVAATGEAIRTEKEGRDCARAWLGILGNEHDGAGYCEL
jgi:hypothetical protein